MKTRAGLFVAGLAALALLSAAPASASYETVDSFGGTLTVPPKDNEGNPIWPEEAQMGGASGMAINRTGAGGVAAGTVYVMGGSVEGWRVDRFSPDGNFEMAWGYFSPGGYLRCGPKGDAAHPHCPAVPFAGTRSLDVEINQATGDVYLFLGSEFPKGVSIFNPDGTGPITEFGESDVGGTIATSPAKLHGSSYAGNIAVNDEGVVYLFDGDKESTHRLMIFEPKTPDVFTEYEYAGEIANGPLGTHLPTQPVLDDAGNVYVADEESIQAWDPAQPSVPICEFELKTGGIMGFTVDPATGSPLYYNGLPANRKIHQLSACVGGKFLDTGAAFPVAPQRGEITAMAFNPALHCGPPTFKAPVCEIERSAGVLYAGAPEACPTLGSCPAGAVGQSALGYILAPPQEAPPKVESEVVTQVTTSSATLGAQINPKGSATRYAFQYVTAAAYEENEPADRFSGATEAPLGGALLGSGQQALSASVALSGLTPDTAYRYRVIATSKCSSAEPSKVCESSGEDRAFRTFPIEAPDLPDERAWELVSPAQKNGGEVLPAEPLRSTCGGECKPGLAVNRFPTQLAPEGNGISYQGFPFFNDGASEFDEYVSRRSATGWQTTSLSPPLAGDSGAAGFQVFALDGALAKGLVYAKNPALTPEAPAGYSNLFTQPTSNRLSLDPLLRETPPHRTATGVEEFSLQYAGASADLSRVFFAANDALTAGTAFAPEAKDGGAGKLNLYEWSEGQLRLVNVQPDNAETIPGASFGLGSANAISKDGSRVFWSDEAGQAYVRENGETTRAIPDPGKFLSAAPDGSEVLLSNGHVYDLESKITTDLTGGKGGFLGLSGQSEDLSHLYFVDTEVLDAAPNEQGDEAQAGKPNLYSWQGGEATFIATMLPTDGIVPGPGVWEASPVIRGAEASPDGRWLAFTSKAELTGIDSLGACVYDPTTLKYVGTVPCEEAFLYDSQSGELACVSCNPVGEHPHGGSFLLRVGHAEAYFSQPRYLTNEGRLYFDSRDSLSVHDTNGNVEDVYQYEPNGVGGCTKQGGCVNLISAGHERVDSNLFAIDEEGRNVFFTSRDQLVLKDKDDAIDLYVAREDGGFPSESEVARSECQGEACQPQVAAPNDPTPGSSTIEGAGNVDEQVHKKKHKGKKRRHAKKKHAHKRATKHNRGGTR